MGDPCQIPPQVCEAAYPSFQERRDPLVIDPQTLLTHGPEYWAGNTLRAALSWQLQFLFFNFCGHVHCGNLASNVLPANLGVEPTALEQGSATYRSQRSNLAWGDRGIHGPQLWCAAHTLHSIPPAAFTCLCLSLPSNLPLFFAIR